MTTNEYETTGRLRWLETATGKILQEERKTYKGQSYWEPVPTEHAVVRPMLTLDQRIAICRNELIELYNEKFTDPAWSEKAVQGLEDECRKKSAGGHIQHMYQLHSDPSAYASVVGSAAINADHRPLWQKLKPETLDRLRGERERRGATD